ncbi:methyltransferase domain-containing protein [Undibacterium sp. Jales W-56]|uniref:rhamnosyltransferase WsaF family glycosyltransferase n=1 Tax=Undibacterium sp. Jales W-56 TaxID=2897325 RepID=UPI0021D1B359|nr:rhamnan synthesis F family protein [Undibacterium sp. Jales W-56]MCU6434919.1 methyltransferase domain-containing protein [Undibacterium sp. Jales W-56]
MNRYQYEFDAKSDSIAARIVRLVGYDKRVLELGCASGHMAQVFAANGCQVIGIEMDADAAEQARKVCLAVYEVNLDDRDWVQVLSGQEKFDVVVVADVLEHLRNPRACIANVRRLLTDDGIVIISTPNIAHGGVIAGLMQGNFQYRETGLLDRTHIHFFTKNSLREALEEEGFAINHFDSVEAGVDHLEFSEQWAMLPSSVRELVRRLPDAMAFQFIVTASKVNNSISAQELRETHRQLERVKSSIQTIENEAAHHISHLRQHVEELTGAVKFLEAQRHANELQIAELERVQASERHANESQIAELERVQALQLESLALKSHVIAQRENEIQQAQQVIQQIYNSSSWKLMAPVRKLSGLLPARLKKILHLLIHRFYIAGKLIAAHPIKGWAEVFKAISKNVSPPPIVPSPHFAPPTDDFCVEVPFFYDTGKHLQPSLMVICHMYYTDLAQEFKEYFLNIPYQFDLYITTDSDQKKQEIETAFADWNKGKLEVRLAKNRGRDIAPKLITCNDLYSQYEFVLHVHTKKSPHRGNDNGWREFLLNTLLGSSQIVESVFEAFSLNPLLGMIAPQHLDDVRPYVGWGWNFEHAQNFAHRMGISISLDGVVDFPSGSMFWARTAALRPLLDLQLNFRDFPEESGQIDGTLGHVIERMYFLVTEKAGFSWLKIALPSTHENGLERITRIENQQDLRDFLENDLDFLLDSQNIVNPYKRPKTATQQNTKKLNKRERIYQRAYERSSYKGMMDFTTFVKEINYLTEGKKSSIDFNEKFYLKANQEVAQQVNLGMIPSGYIHFCVTGQFDRNIIWSDCQLERRFFMAPKLAEGFISPVNLRAIPAYQPDLTYLPMGSKPFLLIFFSHLQDDLFFAGYTEFFKDFKPIIDQFPRVVISVAAPNFNKKLANRYAEHIEVINDNELKKLENKPDLIVCFNSELFFKAKNIFNDLDRTIYYCQDFEAGFFPLGTTYVRAEMAITHSKNIIISSNILVNYFKKYNLLDPRQNVYITTPKIELVHVLPGKSKRLFFYFRPESFNSRNLPELLMEAAEQFCKKYSGYELYLLGSVDTCYSYAINGNSIFVISKLPKDEYSKLLSTCDVAISMIYSAHPGVIAFQTAASGIPTVTNTFDNRDADLLKQISDNIVPYDPVKDNLLDSIELALAMPKGTPSFRGHLYSVDNPHTFPDFIEKIMKN